MRANVAVALESWDDPMFEFGSFRIDPHKKILWREGKVVPLGPKVVHTLAILVSRREQVISREELIHQVWGDTIVEENNLAHNISVLRKTLKEDPGRAFAIETVPRRGYRFSKASQADVAEIMANASRPQLVAIQHAETGTRRRWLRLAMALGLLLLAGSVVYLAGRHLRAKGTARRSVAVIGFVNLSHQADSAWLSPALAEMMGTELAAGGKLLTIPDETVSRARVELKLDDRDDFSAETLGRLRQDLNAEVVVGGAYAVLPPKAEAVENGSQPVAGQVRLDLRVQDTKTGEVLDAISETGEQSDLFDLVARAGTRVRQDLGVETATAEVTKQASAATSSNPQAVRLYAEGTEKLRSFDALGARDLLQQAVQADPNYALAHSALAETWMALGYNGRAAEAAGTAYRLSGTLGLEQKLLVEGQYREAAHQWKKAAAAYQTLLDAYPDDLEYGLRLARAQRLGAQYREALMTVGNLRRLPAPFAGDPRIDLEESKVHITMGDVAAAESAADAAEQKGKARGSGLLIAQAKLLTPEGAKSFANDQEDARRICQSLGDMDCVGQALLQVAKAQDSQPASESILIHALAIFNDLGDERRVGQTQTELGAFYVHHADLVKGRQAYSEARATCEKIEDLSCVTKTILNDGDIDNMTGDVGAAKRKFQQALVIARQTGEDQLVWGSLNNIAVVLTDYEGNLAEAETIDRELVEIDRKDGRVQRMNFTLSNLGTVMAEEGQLAEARRMLEEVEDWSMKSRGKPDFGNSAVSLAEIDVAENRGADAEARLLPMAKVLEDEKDGFAVTYYDGIANALLAQNKPVEAQRAAAHARRLLSDSDIGFDSYHLSIIEARAMAAANPHDPQASAKALAMLRDVINQCRRRGFVGLEFQARLAEGQIEMQSGQDDIGRVRLASLERDASTKGFGTIAREASVKRELPRIPRKHL
ncbi:MAG TPA: winged helix-turn-helix domain-containing protein [Terriglobales bacterium]